MFLWESIIQSPRKATGLTVKQPFFPTLAREMDRTAKKNKTDDVDSSSFECPDPKRTEEFDSPEELDIHFNVFGHRRPAEPEKVGLYDQLRIDNFFE